MRPLALRTPKSAWKYLLVLNDVLLILVAFVAAYYIRYELQWFRSVDPAYQVDIWTYAPFALALVIILPISFRFSGVYPYRRGRSVVEETYHIATAVTVGVVVLITVGLFFSPLLYSRLIFLYFAFLVTMLLGMSRFGIQMLRGHLRRYEVGVDRVLLIGAGDVGRMVMRTVAARPDYGYQLVGFLDDNPAKSENDIGPFKALGPVDNLGEVLDDLHIDTVIICLPWQSHRMIQRLLRSCEQRNVRAQVVPDLFQVTMNQVYVDDFNGIPLIGTRGVNIQGWNLIIKRASDLVIGGLGALISLPLAGVIALAIKLDSPGPVLFRQTRSRQERRAVHVLQVPLHGSGRGPDAADSGRDERGDGPAVQGAQRPAAHACGALAAALQPGRTAAVDQRDARRDEPGRAAAQPA